MLSGRGVYALGEATYEVRENDFIYMAPFCPQTFSAVDVTEYLLYKDVYRDGF